VQLTGLSPRTLDGAGRAVFFSTLAGAVVESNNASLWRATPGAAPELLVREGDAAPGAGFGVVFAAPSGPAAFRTTVGNTAGDLLFETNVHGPGTSDTNDEALYIRDAAGTRLFLREGDPVPGLTGFVFGNGTSAGFDGAVSFSDRGDVALTANIANGAGTARAILSDHTGSLGVLVRSGDPAPGGGSLDFFSRPVMNAVGEVAFLASTAASPTRRGLWMHSAGVLRALALPGQPVPGQPDGPSFDTVQSIHGFNDDGFVLFTAIVLGPNGFGNTALLLADPGGSLRVLARTGATLTLAAGDVRTVSEIDVRLDVLNRDSRAAFGVRFTDGSGAEFRAFAVTAEITHVRVSRSSVTWDPATDQEAGTLYQVVRGSLAALPVGSVPASEICLAEGAATEAAEATVPASRSGFWYLVRAKHPGGTSTYGFARQDGLPAAERASEACP
jgi:hypothetical protein